MAKRAKKKVTKKPLRKASRQPASKATASRSTRRRSKASAKPAVRGSKPGKPVSSVKKRRTIDGPGPVAPVVQTPRAVSQTERFAVEVARTCRDDHCENVLVLDVRGVSTLTDFIVIASGTSDRQMHSVLRHCEELGRASKSPAVRTASDERATWLVADFVDVTLHLFEPQTRSHYDLEMLWGDAPRVEWERPDQGSRDRAGLAFVNA
jgi:ribosome-associated protein